MQQETEILTIPRKNDRDRNLIKEPVAVVLYKTSS